MYAIRDANSKNLKAATSPSSSPFRGVHTRCFIIASSVFSVQIDISEAHCSLNFRYATLAAEYDVIPNILMFTDTRPRSLPRRHSPFQTMTTTPSNEFARLLSFHPRPRKRLSHLYPGPEAARRNAKQINYIARFVSSDSRAVSTKLHPASFFNPLSLTTLLTFSASSHLPAAE